MSQKYFLLNLLHLMLIFTIFKPRPTEAHTTLNPINKDFVFPGGASYSKIPKATEEAVDEPLCDEKDAGKPLCTKVRNYPNVTNLENKLARDFEKFQSFFGSDLLTMNISNRMNGEPAEESLCKSQERIIFPEAGITRDNNKMFIVNSDTYKQGVRIEECMNENSPCQFMESAPPTYKHYCKQNYIYRPLVSYTKDKELTTNAFRLPSCCMCMLRIEP